MADRLLAAQADAIDRAVIESRIKSVCRGRSKALDARAIRALVVENDRLRAALAAIHDYDMADESFDDAFDSLRLLARAAL